MHKLRELLVKGGGTLSQRRFAACSEVMAVARTWLQSETAEAALYDVAACCLAPSLLAAGEAAALDQLVKQINRTGEELPLRIKRADLLLS